ncbi:MAG: hypothetical protein PF495_20360 [Spirochaetales bacterium]|jgi:Flp pilus assembly pilin Flp|nr:hypothetical protein [Spirochaetales bacterium]
MKTKLKRKQGQAMVEYIIIVAVVAIAAVAMFGLFGDTLKKKMAGSINELDSGADTESATGEDSADQFKGMDKDGFGD